MNSKLKQKKLLAEAEENPAFFMVKLMNQVSELEKQIDARVDERLLENPTFAKKVVNFIKGQMPTPKRGIDFFTEDDQLSIVNDVLFQMGGIHKGAQGVPGPRGRPGLNGKPGKPAPKLKPGIDYFTPSQTKALVEASVKNMFEMKKQLDKDTPPVITRDEVNRLIGMMMEKIDFKRHAVKIARALETLRGKDQLDFSALKNVPSFEKSEASLKGRRMVRGAGESTLYYDLSALCDGVTKTFTIPSNKRVLGVWGSDFPLSYRPSVDWTGSGTTTLTLTADTPAPSQGANLFILYVPA